MPSLNEQLVSINTLIAQGNWTQAESLAESLRHHPQAGRPATALLALSQALSGKRESSTDTLKQFGPTQASDKAETLLAVGSAAFRNGILPPAHQWLKRAHELSPQHPLVNARLGACLLAMGRAIDAKPYIEQSVTAMPSSGGAWLNLAHVRMLAGEHAAAFEAIEKAAPLPDKEADVYSSLRAEILTQLGRSAEALEQLRSTAQTGEQRAVTALVRHLTASGRHDEAWQAVREALETQPQQAELLELAAELSQVRGRYGEADRYLSRALDLQPENANLWRRRAMMSSRRLGAEAARVAADKALELTQTAGGANHALSLAAHAHVLGEEEKLTEAEAAYQAALALHRQCIPALRGLGHLLMQVGRVEEATALYEELKEIAPLQGWSQLIHAREIPEDESVLQRMEEAAHRPSLEGPVQSNLLFTLASAWEKKGNHEKAWDFVTQANAATKTHLNYRPEVHRQRVEREMARFSKNFMASRAGWGLDTDVPVFVLGMPRSGTTLVEQILGSHSQVFGAGELSLVPELIQKLNAWENKLGSRREYPECADDMTAEESRRFAEKHLQELQAYAPQAARIVDKLPHNFEHVGLIKLLFPKARILHLRREPRDVAMSNYFVDYGAKFGGMGFAYDLSWIGEQLVDHQRLMDHWHQVFPGQILEVDYDELVEDVEGWAKTIIDYLGLPWEENVLSFQQLDRAVKTASVWQVRQPVYKTSKAKWRRYEQHLAPLEAALAEVPPMPVPSPLPQLTPGLFLTGMGQLQNQQPSEAESTFRQLLTARPSHAAATHFLGATLLQQGKKEEARKAIRRSLELKPGQVQWLENLIKVEQSLGNQAEADALRQRLERGRRQGRTFSDISENVPVSEE